MSPLFLEYGETGVVQLNAVVTVTKKQRKTADESWDELARLHTHTLIDLLPFLRPYLPIPLYR